MKFLAICLALVASLSAEEKKEEVKPIKEVDRKASYKEAFYYKPGFVISPFKPYNVINVKHLSVGDLAYDPTTALIDPKTGKLDLSGAKIFRVPKPRPKPEVTATAPAS